MKIKNLFILSWKKLAVVFVVEVLAIILHNMVFAAFGVEDAIFFILAIFVIPIYLVLAVLFTLLRATKK